jgi:hypothetical protein
MDMEIVEKLVKCLHCNNEFNHYDYLAHSEICYLGNSIDYGYEADTEYTIENTHTNTNTNTNTHMHIHSLEQSYKLNYPSRIQPTQTIGTSNILEELMQSQNQYNFLENITGRLNNITFNNISISGISRNDLLKYSNIIQLHNNNSYECPICLIIHPFNKQYIKIKCGHLFCIDCGPKWFEYKALCPICKCDIRY